MDLDSKIVAQILQDWRQQSSAESELRSHLNAKIAHLERELETWNDEGFKDNKRIRDLKLRVHELERALSAIVERTVAGPYKLDRDACTQLARELLAQGGYQ